MGSLQIQGRSYKGIFRNGYYQEGDKLVNPFMPEHKVGIDSKLVEKQNRLKYFFFEKVDDLSKLDGLIRKSTSHNRVPVILPSSNAKATKGSVFEQLGRKVTEFDLRRNYLLKEKGEYNEHRVETRNNLAEAVLGGGILAINLDDSDCDYAHSFYPDL
jgi:hypothetical protein